MVYEGEKRFSLGVRLADESSRDVETIKNLQVSAPNGSRIPLAQLADIKLIEGPAQISREDTRRRIGIELNVRGRDIGSFVKDAQAAIEQQVKLPPGYYLTWELGMRSLLRSGKGRLRPPLRHCVTILSMSPATSPISRSSWQGINDNSDLHKIHTAMCIRCRKEYAYAEGRCFVCYSYR